MSENLKDHIEEHIDWLWRVAVNNYMTLFKSLSYLITIVVMTLSKSVLDLCHSQIDDL